MSDSRYADADADADADAYRYSRSGNIVGEAGVPVRSD